MAKRPQVLPDVDDDAATPPKQPAGTHDVDHAIRLLEWGRRNGFIIGPTLKVGETTMQVQDLRVIKREGLRGDVPPDKGIYAEHGLDDDDVPADGTSG